MPLAKIWIPTDLITLHHDRSGAVLNRQRYQQFEGVRGEPTYTPGAPGDAVREAFVALKIAEKRALSGDRQQIYLGEPAIEILYGRAHKHANEQDCDVIGYVSRYGSYGYILGEGKGSDIIKAMKQFNAALHQLSTRKDAAGQVIGAVVAMKRIRCLEWNASRKQWIAYADNAEEVNITNRLQRTIASAKPGLRQDRIYLLDGEEQDDLPVWNVVKSVQPLIVYVHERTRGSEQGLFRPLRVGAGNVELYYVS